jgi:hypothetical protein
MKTKENQTFSPEVFARGQPVSLARIRGVARHSAFVAGDVGLRLAYTDAIQQPFNSTLRRFGEVWFSEWEDANLAIELLVRTSGAVTGVEVTSLEIGGFSLAVTAMTPEPGGLFRLVTSTTLAVVGPGWRDWTVVAGITAGTGLLGLQHFRLTRGAATLPDPTF